jgi:prepilin-type N-terminal cleavage/methylation domain-containing protein
MSIALLRSRSARGRLASERGFTMIELLVSLIAGGIISTASLYTVIVSLHFSSNYQDRIDSNQQGRVAMVRVMQVLDSACVAAQVPPVVAGSTATKLVVYSNQSDASTIEPNLVTIQLTGGALTMGTQAWSSGAYPNYSFSGTTANFTLLPHAVQATLNGSGSQPVFQYYGYSAGGVLSTTPYAVPLSGANAATTAEVTVAFQALPTDNWNSAGRGANFNDSAVLRLTPASGDSTASNAPCT